MEMKEEILSIASDLREGSMTTNEAKEHLLRLFGVVGSLPLSKNCEYFNSDECDCMDGFCHYGEKG